MWDQRYGESGYAYGTEPNDFLKEMAPRLTPGRCLCLAEGEGRNAVFLAGRGFEVTAVDASSVGMDKAAQLAQQRGVALDTVVSDLADYRVQPDHWDAIVSIFCHVPLAIRRPLHRAVVAGLRPGGMLLLEAYTPRQLELGTGGPKLAELTMQLVDLRDELAGLEFLHALETERDVVEGKYHTGRGAVVQVLAQKPLA